MIWDDVYIALISIDVENIFIGVSFYIPALGRWKWVRPTCIPASDQTELPVVSIVTFINSVEKNDLTVQVKFSETRLEFCSLSCNRISVTMN